MCFRAADLPTERIRTRIDNTLYEMFDGDVKLAGLYIYGSYGADEATADSDIDVIIAVGPPDLDAETIANVAYLFGNGWELNGTIVDPMAVPAAEAAGYLQKACSQRGYDTVYDIRRDEYVSPSDVTPTR